MDLISRYYDLLEYVSLFAVDSGMKCLEVLTNPVSGKIEMALPQII